MILLLDSPELAERRRIAAGALAPLAESLRAELDAFVAAPPELPREKALLTRAGGRCAADGSYLRFDPWDPRHRCVQCGAEHVGAEHDRFRLYWYQLWLAERTLHAALFAALGTDESAGAAASTMLERYAEQYLAWPNADNVLGPSRPFFSTYLESIWLFQLCVALDLLERDGTGALGTLGGRVRDRVLAPSASLIASYDEGLSNRQVWNGVALLAAGRLLDDRSLVAQAIDGPSGLTTQLMHGLLADGSWYEGENYHLFAHRGLWYGVRLARSAGVELPPSLLARFRDGFAAPFRTTLPDLTHPARRDSPYAVSVRQPRFAEACELGLAEGDDDRLTSMLARLYSDDIPRRGTGRRASSADVERPGEATALTRADLSWRALLAARETLPELVARPLESDLLPEQGFAVLRTGGGRIYAGLDYGHSGGGHGHPDRLNVLFSVGNARWFDDPGTGSYVDPTLFWYRSTLAHTAPLVDRRTQPRVHGTLEAYDVTAGARWVRARAPLAPDLVVRRTLVLRDDLLVDHLEWEGATEHEVALPLHDLEIEEPPGEQDAPGDLPPAPVGGEDGWAFLRDVRWIRTPRSPVSLSGRRAEGARLEGWVVAPPGTRWLTALSPAPPTARGAVRLLLPTLRAPSGRFVGVYCWTGAVRAVRVEGDRLLVERTDGTCEVHAPTSAGWQIRHGDGRVTELTGRHAPSPEVGAGTAAAPAEAGRPHAGTLDARGRRVVLGDVHYRRSEIGWAEAGSPGAVVELVRTSAGGVRVSVLVEPSRRFFRDPAAANPFENEPFAIHGDGVQLYLAAGGRETGVLLVPRHDSTSVAVLPAGGWRCELPVSATWRPTADGYSLTAEVEIPPWAEPPFGATGGSPAAGRTLALDVLVNDAGVGRERRRGQLVLSGARGEFVYLRGDRHERDRLLRFTLDDA